MSHCSELMGGDLTLLQVDLESILYRLTGPHYRLTVVQRILASGYVQTGILSVTDLVFRPSCSHFLVQIP